MAILLKQNRSLPGGLQLDPGVSSWGNQLLENLHLDPRFRRFFAVEFQPRKPQKNTRFKLKHPEDTLDTLAEKTVQLHLPYPIWVCNNYFLSNILVFRCDFLVLPKESAPKNWALATSSSTIPPGASTLEQSMRLSLLRLRSSETPHVFIGSKKMPSKGPQGPHHNWVGSIIILLCDGGEQTPTQSHLNKDILVKVEILSTWQDQGLETKKTQKTIGDRPRKHGKTSLIHLGDDNIVMLTFIHYLWWTFVGNYGN